MAGSITISLTQQLDGQGKPLNGGQLQFYAAGTTAPQSAYQDIGLTIPWPNPLTLDSGARVPQLFFADGYVKYRLSDAAGVTITAADFVLVLGPTSGGGAAPSVDATTVLATGDIKIKYGTGSLSGFVRANGRTVGSATSGASERSNSDTQALFEYLWGADANLAVSTGRGVSANADWTANKTIGLPDWRGRVLAGLDDMGNSAAGRLTSTYFGTAATALGASGGAQSANLSIANINAFTPTGTITNGAITINHNANSANSNQSTGGGGFSLPGMQAATITASQATSTFTGGSLGSGTAHSICRR